LTKQERKESITRQRKQQIFDAALRVFSKRGFDQATIPDIAEAAGVAVGTIYNYYHNKHDLLLAIIKSYMVTESFVDCLEESPESSASVFLSFFINERLNIGLDNADVIQLFTSEIQRDPELRRQYIEQVVIPNFKLLEEYLGLKIDQEAIRPSNIPIVARALVGMTIGLSMISKFEGETGIIRKIPRQELVTEVTKLILEGIKCK
jgi:TetR/AcrR family fatty acid metabolism transcriptional regulator